MTSIAASIDALRRAPETVVPQLRSTPAKLHPLMSAFAQGVVGALL
jgi:hypothetical protein